MNQTLLSNGIDDNNAISITTNYDNPDCKIHLIYKILLKIFFFIPLLVFTNGAMAEVPTNAPIIGNVESLTIDNPNDPYSSGVIVVGGTDIIIPRNMVIELPANFLTLWQLIDESPSACAGTSGLAATDQCTIDGTGGATGVASINANRIEDGRVVAAEVFMEKGQEFLTGKVTHINYDNGYFRVSGAAGADTGGTIVRLNDPTARHSIQFGPGCPNNTSRDNCSPDSRFMLDSDNYTITYITGYPVCIPSTKFNNSRRNNRDARLRNRTSGDDGTGTTDALCPDANRTVNLGRPVQNSFLSAPLKVGDHVAIDGNFETINGTTFLSTYNVTVHYALTTQAGQPDHMIFDEVELDTAGYMNERIIGLIIGFNTLAGSHVEIYALDRDPATDENVERILATTQGCEAFEGAGSCLNQGIGATSEGIFKIRHDVDFIVGVDTRRSPCGHLNAAADANGDLIDGGKLIYHTTCPRFPNAITLFDEVSVLIPNTREMQGRTRNKAVNYPGTIGDNFDVTGRAATWGQYLTPVGPGHPEFVEIDLNAVFTPFIFEGQLWNLDRRHHPAGCVSGNCAADTDVMLDPFPVSCLDPAGQVASPPGGLTAFRNLITTPVLTGVPLAIPACGGV